MHQTSNKATTAPSPGIHNLTFGSRVSPRIVSMYQLQTKLQQHQAWEIKIKSEIPALSSSRTRVSEFLEDQKDRDKSTPPAYLLSSSELPPDFSALSLCVKGKCRCECRGLFFADASPWSTLHAPPCWNHTFASHTHIRSRTRPRTRTHAMWVLTLNPEVAVRLNHAIVKRILWSSHICGWKGGSLWRGWG
jgi:hypothetical protein